MGENKPTDLKLDPQDSERDRLDAFLSGTEGRERIRLIFDDFDDFYGTYAAKGADIGTVAGEKLEPGYPAIISDSGRVYEFKSVEIKLDPKIMADTNLTRHTLLIGVSNSVFTGEKDGAIIFLETIMVGNRVGDPNGLLSAFSLAFKNRVAEDVRQTQRKLREGGVIEMIGVDDEITDLSIEKAYALYEKLLQERKNTGVDLTYENTKDIRESLRTQGIHVVQVNLRVKKLERDGKSSVSRSITIFGLKSRRSSKVREDIGLDSW